MEVGVLSLFAGAIVAKAAADAWFAPGSFGRNAARRPANSQVTEARGGFLRTIR
jgi:hypothetical protein